MEELLAVRRMLELEKMAIDSNIIFPLSLKEWRYMENAMKMPYDDIVNYINYFRKHLLVINQVKFLRDLEEKYSVNEKELVERFKDVHRILRYKNEILDQQLDNQKEMIKRMNNI